MHQQFAQLPSARVAPVRQVPAPMLSSTDRQTAVAANPAAVTHLQPSVAGVAAALAEIGVPLAALDEHVARLSARSVSFDSCLVEAVAVRAEAAVTKADFLKPKPSSVVQFTGFCDFGCQFDACEIGNACDSSP